MWEKITKDFRPVIGKIYDLCGNGDVLTLRWTGTFFVDKYDTEYSIDDFTSIYPEED